MAGTDNKADDDLEVVDMAIFQVHTQTVRYKAVPDESGDVPVLRDVYVQKMALPDHRKPPKRIRIAVAFLKD
jgi:hypothetical protein